MQWRAWEENLEMAIKRIYKSDDKEELWIKGSLEDTVGSLETPISILYPMIFGV